jgi:hypothetical protein
MQEGLEGAPREAADLTLDGQAAGEMGGAQREILPASSRKVANNRERSPQCASPDSVSAQKSPPLGVPIADPPNIGAANEM